MDNTLPYPLFPRFKHACPWFKTPIPEFLLYIPFIRTQNAISGIKVESSSYARQAIAQNTKQISQCQTKRNQLVPVLPLFSLV